MTDLTNRCGTCGHGRADHEALSPQCSASRCTCLKYRPPGPVVVPAAPMRLVPSGVLPAPMRLVPSGVLPAPPPHPPPAPRFDAEALVRACARSEHKRTQAMGVKLADLAEKVVAALRAERESAEAKAKAAEESAAARAQVDKLTKQLAAAKAALKRSQPTPAKRAASAPGDFVCADCDRSFTSPQGLSLHGRRAHAEAAS